MAVEDSAQRRIHLGVAKKIKNGARKIVLDKAEEARIVAFSAFKSLGFSVPQFSRPLLSNTSGNLVGQDASTLSGDDTNIVLCVEQRDHAPSNLSIEGSKNSGKVNLGSGGDKLLKTIDVGLVASAEVNSTSPMQCNDGAENPTVTIEKSSTLRTELDATSDCNKNADAIPSTQLEQNDDGTRMYDRNIDSRLWDKYTRENLWSDKKGSACENGPVNASNTSGGFDSFLDLWDTTQEFYFDIHYNKRLEVNSVTPFEILGIAICWENSPVYYVNLPKDLLWSDNQRNEYLPIGAAGEKNNIQPPENWLETVRQRWNRIGEIMGKRKVRKFTWNLKGQIQVFKSAVVSIRRFGSLNLPGKNLGPDSPELINSSCFLLSPITIKEGIDMCIVAWILWPDEERSSNPNLEKVNSIVAFRSLNMKSRMCNLSWKRALFWLCTNICFLVMFH